MRLYGLRQYHYGLREIHTMSSARASRRLAAARSSPMNDLPDDLIVCSISFLSVRDVLAAARASRRLRTLAYRDAVWAPLRRQLRSSKLLDTHTNIDVDIEGAAVSAHAAYVADIREAARQRLSASELCRLVWQFRFKKAAGWGDASACRAVFLESGVLKRYTLPAMEEIDEHFGIRWRCVRVRRVFSIRQICA